MLFAGATIFTSSLTFAGASFLFTIGQLFYSVPAGPSMCFWRSPAGDSSTAPTGS